MTNFTIGPCILYLLNEVQVLFIMLFSLLQNLLEGIQHWRRRKRQLSQFTSL